LTRARLGYPGCRPPSKEINLSDENYPADRENFGEASLGEAEAEDSPDDPEMIEGEEGAAPDAMTDVPALDPARTDDADEQAEAGRIGGRTNTEHYPPEERPVVEGGEGQAEGFELAEEELIENASHGDGRANPLGDRFTPEEAEAEDLASYGEPDRENVSEDVENEH
jgi:hypothetical protein